MADAVLDIIRSDHKVIRSLLDNLVSALPRHQKNRKNIWGDLRREISRHSLLEEDVLYKRLKKSATSIEFIRQSGVQHGTMDRLISRLEGLQIGCMRWEQCVSELRDVLIHHMDQEERELPRVIAIAFDSTQLQSLILKLKLSRAA